MFSSAGSLSLDTPEIATHQKSGKGNALIKQYMTHDYRDPKDFPSFVYLSQVLQAEAMRIAIEAHRRNMPWCMGSLYWQLNDCWPGVSWSTTDFARRWKAAHYYIKKAFAEVVVFPYVNNNTLEVYVVSDRVVPTNICLRLSIMRFDGAVLWEKSVATTVSPNASQLKFERAISLLLDKAEPDKCMLVATISESDRIIAENVLYFVPVKELLLPTPAIEHTVRSIATGFELTLRSSLLAKNVHLSTNEGEVFFSDNYFDLLPNVIKTVEVFSSLTLEDFSASLQVMSMVDAYQ